MVLNQPLIGEKPATAPSHNNLGTINGCYIPCLLNILGAPLFLFVGFAVGMMGWLGALALFFFSELIAYLTITSFSAIVTNGRMKGGGAYYMISRSLGPAFGGSSGILFWLTYCVNVTFNTRAFSDTIFSTFFADQSKNWSGSEAFWYEFAFSTGTLFLLFLVAFNGAGAFARVNYFIFAGLIVALVAAIGSVWIRQDNLMVDADLGSLQYTPPDLPQPLNGTSAWRYPFAWDAPCPEVHSNGWCLNSENSNGRYGLKQTMLPAPVASGQCDVRPHLTVGTVCDLPHVFSFVFPAVVGMMEGANLSGDLKDPARSIPLGTVGAVSTAFFCYVLLIIGQGATLDRVAMQYDLAAVQHSCVSYLFVVLGVAAACLSTALGSMFGSARIMQAIARDNIFPVLAPLAPGSLKGDEPRRALVVTYLLAQTGLFIGGIDAVAPVLTNFFLVTYTLTNLSAALLELSGVPNFRPHWRYYSWQLSLAGAALTIVSMFFLNATFAVITLGVVVALFIYISLRFDASRWADISQPLCFSAARAALLALGRRAPHPKYWRPQLMLLLPARDAATACLQVAGRLAGRGGLLIAGRAVTPKGSGGYGGYSSSSSSSSSSGGGGGGGGGATDEWCSGAAVMSAREALRSQVAAVPGLGAFEQLCVAPTLRLGLANLLMGGGLGALRPDTVVVPLLDKPPASVSHEAPRYQLPVEGPDEYAGCLGDALALGHNLLVLANPGAAGGAAAEGRVDVWVLGQLPTTPGAEMKQTGTAKPSDAANQLVDAELGLAVQMGHLAAKAPAGALGRLTASVVNDPTATPGGALTNATTTSPYSTIVEANRPKRAKGGAPMRVLMLGGEAAAAGVEGPAEAMQKGTLIAWLHDMRVKARVEKVPLPETLAVGSSAPETFCEWGWLEGDSRSVAAAQAVNAAIREHSADASLVCIALPPPPRTAAGAGARYLEALQVLTADLPPTLLCKSNGNPVVTAEI